MRVDLTLVEAVIVDIRTFLTIQADEVLVEVMVDGFQGAVQTPLIERIRLVDGDVAFTVEVKAFG